ncbi:hypothetical protein [Pedobacter sp. B4-66]|uniref:hypothetical protein n=1 Tax=Pedobacter sp. B4-66 TaxID=2817280 RepID=UPI001BDAB2B8|nr:hypothetical protein [Pedobacter sp. B4-66]
MEITGGKWTVGKYPGVVVTSQRTKYYTEDIERGDWEKQEVEYYGGYILAESIFNPDDAKLMALSPALLQALNEIVIIAKSSNPYLNKDFLILCIANKVMEKLCPNPNLLPEFSESTINRIKTLINKS